ncbi:MAG: tetratricopeptide repeat protein [Promethearchaeota archaeon]
MNDSKNKIEQKNLEVVFSAKSFRDMILFSARFANKAIPEEEWKEVYGFLVGNIRIDNINGKEYLYVAKLIPMIHGTRTEVYFSEQDYSLSEMILDKLLKMNMFICGWFHTHPGLGLFLSETDIYNQLGFQSAFGGAIAAVYDFTLTTEKNNGLKVYRLSNVELGVASSYVEVPYEIEEKKEEKPLFMARSLIDIMKSIQEGGPLIKEAGEIYKERGSIEDLFNDITTTSAMPTATTISKKENIAINQNDSSSLINTKSHNQLHRSIKNVGMDTAEPLLEDLSNIDAIFSQNKFEMSSSEPPPLLQSQDISELSEDDSEYVEYLEAYSENDFQIRALNEKLEKLKEKGEYTAKVLLKLANRYSEISENDKALRFLLDAEKEALSYEKEDDLAIIKNEIGLYYEERGDFFNALNYYEACLDILKKLNKKRLQVHVLNNIASVYFKMSDVANAFNYYKKAYYLARDINYYLGLYATLLNTVEVLLYLKNYGIAYNSLVQCFHYFRSIGNFYGISIVYTLFGKLYFDQGPDYFHLAEKYFKLSIDLKNRVNIPKESIEDWIYLYKIYYTRKKVKEAEFYLSQGLNIARTYDLGREESRFYLLFGDLRYFEDKIDESIEYYSMALEGFGDFGEDEECARICETLATIYLENKNDLENSLSYLYKALDYYRNLRYSKMIAENLTKIADIHISLGDYGSAKECLLEARSIYLQLYDNYSANLIDQKLKTF